MESVEMICIRCPIGCRMTVTPTDGQPLVAGNTCRRGEQYAIQEVLSPMRTVTSSVSAEGGVRPLVSVKTASEVPKASIPEVLQAIRQAKAQAPVRIGQVLIADVARTGVDLIATSNLPAK